MRTLCRAGGVAIAIAALIDPAIGIQQRVPLPVRLHVDERDTDAAAVASRLQRSLAGQVEFRDYGPTAAAVAIDGVANADLPPLDVPVSTVSFDGSPDVAVVDSPAQVPVLAGSPLLIEATLDGRGVARTASVVVAEENGIELGRVEHTWDQDGHARVAVPYLAAAAGTHRVTLRVSPAAGETRLQNNAADVAVLATARPARVAVIEARPSWQAGFVRRALEDDPAFAVSSLVRMSKGVGARSGDVSRQLRRGELDGFDVILAGAPEDLSAAEVDVLREFAAIRGGTVIVLPDRRAGGPYQALLPGTPEEQLLASPQTLAPANVMASELLAFADNRPGISVLARTGAKAVIVSSPMGDGRIVLSGTLDAWRYRADPRSTFTRFWRETVLAASFTAPPPLDIRVQPAVVRPHQSAHVTVRLRRTEYEESREGAPAIAMPAVSPTIVAANGQAEMIRLWPATEPGVFEGTVAASAAGPHNVRVTADSGAAADTVLIVETDASLPRRLPLDGIPEATGGVAVQPSNLDPLVAHLLSLPRPSRRADLHPMRSAWWMIPFAGALSAEWFLRRRAGAR